MQIFISNIVFITDEPKPAQDRLLAVFSVSLRSESGEVTINDFRYYQPTDEDGYVSVPAVKTKRGVVRPVAVNPTLRRLISQKFIEAWKNLPRPGVTA